jgi:hypothetical protein
MAKIRINATSYASRVAEMMKIARVTEVKTGPKYQNLAMNFAA